ncbi:MAG TPA: hypothetical protein PLZ38_03995 [Spirochaetota bacterium]|nr:hypothetical protein [Spirochaetota bacterium]HOF12887.1 hypothetical protein [Spirochaetota bacterium]HOM88264.1 hypothetical protein [Spirochaetota bacterium]HOR93110.1 hypothetical protein [Spirochaetota bacterium]HOT19812.1 hypothetical protein [Spirochaetota bacterium]
MDFETTTCISCKHLEILDSYCKKLDVSLRTCIVYMILYAAKKEKKKAIAFKRICYRKRDKDNPWKRVHLVLYQSEYEFCLDVKKLWKMSLANIIAFCVENVLVEFFEYFSRRLKEINSDNYPYNLTSYYENRSYTFDFHKEKGIHCLKFYWGPPPEVIEFNKKQKKLL